MCDPYSGEQRVMRAIVRDQLSERGLLPSCRYMVILPPIYSACEQTNDEVRQLQLHQDHKHLDRMIAKLLANIL